MQDTERRKTDIETERRMATLEQQHREAKEWRGVADKRFDCIDDKLDKLLGVVERVAGGWWALAKAAGIIVASGTAIASAVMWAINHLSIRPAVVLSLLLMSTSASL